MEKAVPVPTVTPTIETDKRYYITNFYTRIVVFFLFSVIPGRGFLQLEPSSRPEPRSVANPF